MLLSTLAFALSPEAQVAIVTAISALCAAVLQQIRSQGKQTREAIGVPNGQGDVVTMVEKSLELARQNAANIADLTETTAQTHGLLTGLDTRVKILEHVILGRTSEAPSPGGEGVSSTGV